MGWFSDLFSKSKPSTTTITDPAKAAVSNPLSSYLASQVGTGTPDYTATTGKKLTYSLADVGGESSYTDILSMNAGDWYTKAVQDPTLKAAKEAASEVSEGWAGSLRGSGRFSDVEDYWSDVTETLQTGRYAAEKDIASFKYNTASNEVATKNAAALTEYNAWYQSLAQNNPALGQALQYLSGANGTDVLSYSSSYPIYELLPSLMKLASAMFGSSSLGSSGGGSSSSTSAA